MILLINERGTWAELLRGDEALLPGGYYALHVPQWLRLAPQALTRTQRTELGKFGAASRVRPELSGVMPALFDRLLPRLKSGSGEQHTLERLAGQNGFDRAAA